MKKTRIIAIVVLVLGMIGETMKADFTFGTPTNLGPTVNTGAMDIDSSISSDGLSLYFNSNRSGGYGKWDIWVTTRDTMDDEWGTAVNIGLPVNSSSAEASPRISTDNLSLFFLSDRAGGYGAYDIWVATRTTVSDPWSEPVNLGPTINSVYNEGPGNMPADGLEFYLTSDRPGGSGAGDLWVATRTTAFDSWAEPVNLGPTVNSSLNDGDPSVSADGLMLFFKSVRPEGLGDHDLYMTRRATVSDPWGEPMNLGPLVNSPGGDELPSISADGSTLYFSSGGRAGGQGYYDLWQVSIDPIVDLNDDGIVDAADMCIIVDHWGIDEPLCDIGPMPWGDGVVDVQDLIVLAEHLFEEVTDPTLLAHWALDEAEGNVAHESVSGSDDVVMGNPLWQPTGGKVDGALELDGVDDCVISSAGPNPADGPFSVFAWVKRGAPGQVIISQPAGANWLMTDQEGRLLTELGMIARVGPLLSEVVITDGQWYRIGLVWDGSQRKLCADGVVVAEDTPSGLGASGNGLYIGAGKDFAPGTFWSGLIDDVRIYSRAMAP